MKKWMLLLPKTILSFIVGYIIYAIILSIIEVTFGIKLGLIGDLAGAFLVPYIVLSISPTFVDSHKKYASFLATIGMLGAFFIMYQEVKYHFIANLLSIHVYESMPSGIEKFLTRASTILGIIAGNYSAYKNEK